MASIIKRGNSWRASISRKGFRKTATFDKKKMQKYGQKDMKLIF